MPDQQKYNMSYRPRSYWKPSTLSEHYGATVKGEMRRSIAKREAESGTLPDLILKHSLSESERQATGQLHPWAMGGEYLPDLAKNEVEIARVVLKSVTMDVISVRARREGDLIPP
jgi:hypothetical protein